MSKMDNHIDRPEISNAIKDGISKIERYSNNFYFQIFGFFGELHYYIDWKLLNFNRYILSR